jgi:hypothetical protein
MASIRLIVEFYLSLASRRQPLPYRVTEGLPVIRSEVDRFSLSCPPTSSQKYSIAPLRLGGVVPKNNNIAGFA